MTEEALKVDLTDVRSANWFNSIGRIGRRSSVLIDEHIDKQIDKFSQVCADWIKIFDVLRVGWWEREREKFLGHTQLTEGLS